MKGRNYYREGFDLNKWKPLSMDKGRVIFRAILPSDYDQIVSTDMVNEVKMCKVWQVIDVSIDVDRNEMDCGDHIVILTAGLDILDPDSPREGIVDVKDIAAKVLH